MLVAYESQIIRILSKINNLQYGNTDFSKACAFTHSVVGCYPFTRIPILLQRGTKVLLKPRLVVHVCFNISFCKQKTLSVTTFCGSGTTCQLERSQVSSHPDNCSCIC